MRSFITLFLIGSCIGSATAGEASCPADGSGRGECGVAEKLLQRPPHKMPAATWHLQDSDAVAKMAAKGPLGRDQLDAFYRDGFLVLEDFYPLTAIEAVQADVEQQVATLARDLFAAGKVQNLYEGLDWTKRLNSLRKEYEDAPIVLIKRGVLPKSLQDMFADPRILDVAAQLGVGPDVAVNAAWNLRAKMQAHEETVVPWHQDNSYWEPRNWDENVLTIWVSLVEATRQNGCMQFIRGGHLSGKVANHTIGSSTTTWYTELAESTAAEELLAKKELNEEVDIATIETKPGTVIIFPGTTPHRSLNSLDENIRWSADWRLHRKHAQRVGKSELDWFYGVKDSLLLREDPAVDPNYRPDWSVWANVERTAAQDSSFGLNAEKAKIDLDPLIVGPWMDLWDIEKDKQGRPNRHLERYLSGSQESLDPAKYISKGNW